MSWLDDIQGNLTITTGEGSVFTPVWKNASKLVSYNSATFEFSNVAGTLVRRRLPRGNQYAMEMYFQGEEHLQESIRFEVAARDTRPWVISHPYYGRLSIQPVQLSFDNSDYNVTKITGTVFETIEGGVDTSISVQDQIISDAEVMGNDSAENVTSIDQETRNRMDDQVVSTYQNYQKDISTGTDLNTLTTLYNTARTAVQRATQEPIQAMRAVQNLLNMPYSIENTVNARIAMLGREVRNLFDSIAGIVNYDAKTVFEASASNALATLAKSASAGSYGTRSEVLDVIGEITSLFDGYLTTLDSIQGDNYYPRREILAQLEGIVNNSINELFSIAQRAKQERTYMLEDNSDVILLTHRFYGLDADDLNIDQFMDDNEIGLNEILEIQKGRSVVYYV